MSEQTPPYPYFNGIIYNQSLFGGQSGQYLPRTGVATSVATSTTFNGIVYTSGLTDSSTISANNLSVLGTNNFNGLSYVNNTLYLNDTPLYIRQNDPHHGICYGLGTTTPSLNIGVDGPYVFGYYGGALGTTNGGNKLALQWNTSGVVTLPYPPVMSGASITSRTIPDGSLSTNIPLLSASNTFIGSLTTFGNIKVNNRITAIYSISNSNNLVYGDTLLPFISASCFDNVVVGLQSLTSGTSSNNNVCLGNNCMSVITSGGSNVAMGNQSLASVTTGIENTAVGTTSLQTNTTGGQNTAIGTQALINNTTGSNNTAIGYNAGPTSGTTYSNSTCIGANSVITASNQLVLGVSTTNVVCLGTLSSSGLITASNGLTLSSGTLTLPANSILDSALSTNIPLKSGTNSFSGSNTFTGSGINITNGVGGGVNLQQTNTNTQTIQWLNSTSSALANIYASTLSSVLSFDITSLLTNGIRFTLAGSNLMTLSTTGLMTLLTSPAFSYTTLPTLSSTQLGYSVPITVNSSGSNVASQYYLLATITSMPIGVFIINYTVYTNSAGSGMKIGLTTSSTTTSNTYLNGTDLIAGGMSSYYYVFSNTSVRTLYIMGYSGVSITFSTNYGNNSASCVRIA